MAEHIGRPATYKDKPCELCNQPMIGIMRDAGPRPPRKICEPCGGRPIKYDDNGIEVYY